MNEDYGKHPYKVKASTPTRFPWPVYKFMNNPKEWHCNGNVFVSCYDGVVDVKIYEEGTNHIHQLNIKAVDDKCIARLVKQVDHPEKP